MLRHRLIKLLFSISLIIGGALVSYAQYDQNAFFMRGRRALSDGKYSQAIENFNVLVRLDSTDYYTYFFRGIAKYNLGDLRGAKADFDKSVEINPVFTSGYHYRGITESRFGNYEDALNDIQHAISLRPGFIGLYFSRGVTYFLSQQFENAVKDFDRYIRKEPKDPSGYLNRGASYLFLGDTTKALNDYNKAIRLDRYDPEGYIRRGRLYAQQEKFEQAILDMNKAIDIDPSNTFAYFNRAIMKYSNEDYVGSMADLNRVLKDEPGNALTLYNRALISAQLGEYEAALEDMDRVLSINPNNVLAYFNRASILIELGLYRSALEDYTKAIELYPDFAKAYMNRAYVKNLLGDFKSSKKDYDIAQNKVQEYRKTSGENVSAFADTTKKYHALLSLDAEFAKKDFDNELLQHRDVDIKLRPLYKITVVDKHLAQNYVIDKVYENPLLTRFKSEFQIPLSIENEDRSLNAENESLLEGLAYMNTVPDDKERFLRALNDYNSKQFNSAENNYTKAIQIAEESQDVNNLYRAFYLMNRASLRAEMVDFISSMESSVQVLSMDDTGAIRARVKDKVESMYDYSAAIEDLQEVVKIAPDLPYVYFNLGNLYCLSSEHIASIENYTKAIEQYPAMGDAYFNRGLVLIYLKDKEKGCIDMSRAGELGVQDAYGVIKKYCEVESQL